MNGLQVFTYNASEIRTVQIDGEPWWVLKDVCDVLGLSNPSIVANRLDDDEKNTLSINEGIQGNPVKVIISEPGLYSVIMLSRKPEAKQFKRWITHEVLPAIRKTGAYTLPQLSTNELILQIAQANLALEKRITGVEQEVSETREEMKTAIKSLAAPGIDRWKEDINRTIDEIVASRGLSPVAYRGTLYREMESHGVRLQSRVSRLRSRLKAQGATYKERKAVTKLDVISRDKQLRPIFEGIVEKHKAAQGII